jgi:hypothetical protein
MAVRQVEQGTSDDARSQWACYALRSIPLTVNAVSRHRLRRSLFEYFKSGFKIKNKILQVRVKRFAQRHLLEPEAKSIQGRETRNFL